MISPDAPIVSAKDDKLGRAPFAKAVAAAIANSVGTDSFVIGIHGKWGSGKSSVLNLFVEEVEFFNKSRREGEGIHIFRFNPWLFADQNQLVLQFLRQFKAHLATPGKTGKKMQSLLESIDEYADSLGPPLRLVPYGEWIVSLLKLGRPLLGASKDVNALFDQISKELLNLKRKTVVIIDDIDRLSSIETRQVFQLVKLSARFPLVTYVLAFDKEAVVRALDDGGGQSGFDYLEKIVQVAYDLPPLSEGALTSMITSALDEVIQGKPPAFWDEHRFGNLFFSGFRNCFTSLRDVRRFVNGLEFGWGLIANELNGVDFIGVEALRCFYPKTFDVVRHNKELFAGHVTDTSMSSGGAKEYEKQVSAILSRTGELERVKDILLELFPKVAFAYGQSGPGHWVETEWEKRHRVAAKRYFDTYFQLTLPTDELSVEQLDAFVAASHDTRLMLEMLRRIKTSNQIKNAIDSIRYRLDGIAQDNLKNLLSAFVEVGDDLSTKSVFLAGAVSEELHLKWAIYDTLQRMPKAERFKTLRETFGSGSAVRTMVSITYMLDEFRKKKEPKYDDVTEEHISELKVAVLNRIKALAAEGKLSSSQGLVSALQAWADWEGKQDDAKDYVQALLTEPRSTAQLVQGFVHEVQSAGIGDRVVQRTKRIWMQGLVRFVDADVLLRCLTQMDKSSLEPEMVEAVSLAVTEINRMHEKGWTPEQYDYSRDMPVT